MKTSLFISLYLILYILMVFLVFFSFWGWLIFQPCLWGYFLGSLIVSFKNPLRVKTHFFAFFNFLIFFSSTLLLLLVSYAILIAPLPSLLVLRPHGGATRERSRLNEDDVVMNGEHGNQVQRVFKGQIQIKKGSILGQF